MRGATRRRFPRPSWQPHFNPRAPCGARLAEVIKGLSAQVFQPTRPLRGATVADALLAFLLAGISTHAPLAGRDPPDVGGVIKRLRFQPTRPLRGATAYQVIYADGAKKISTHAPLAGRDPAKIAVGIIFEISTHAPLAGRDISNLRIYDTPRISTHAPLAGRDGGILGAARAVCAHFNPRAPCGARLSTPPIPHRSYQFQPTRPLRGATCLMLFPCKIELVFQPTRPLRGATAVNRCRRRAYQNFNPRAPCGARRRWKDRKLRRADISTHAPLAGRDDSAG